MELQKASSQKQSLGWTHQNERIFWGPGGVALSFLLGEALPKLDKPNQTIKQNQPAIETAFLMPFYCLSCEQSEGNFFRLSRKMPASQNLNISNVGGQLPCYDACILFYTCWDVHSIVPGFED